VRERRRRERRDERAERERYERGGAVPRRQALGEAPDEEGSEKEEQP